MLRHRWAGGNYSSRIWANAGAMTKQLEYALMENMLAGKTSDKTWEAIVDVAGSEVSCAERLIRTETAYIANQSELYAYMEAGIQKYEYVAVLEARTCPVCGKLDGQVFDITDSRVGKNYPPIHPWCRCTTSPWDKDIAAALDENDTRWSRDPETGEDVQVPMNMSYEQWKKKQQEIPSQQPQRKFTSLAQYDAEIERLRNRHSFLMQQEYYDRSETNALLDRIFELQDQRQDFAIMNNFAGGDTALTNMLRSGNAQQITQAVDTILSGKEYSLPESKWSGKTKVLPADDVSMKKAAGRKEYNCSITIREDYKQSIPTYIHELLHARSISLYGPIDAPDIYRKYQWSEEGAVELMTQEICKKSGIQHEGTYSNQVNALRDIRKIACPKETEYDFAKKVFTFSAKTRYNKVEEMANSYLKSHPRARVSVKQRLDEALNILQFGSKGGAVK